LHVVVASFQLIVLARIPIIAPINFYAMLDKPSSVGRANFRPYYNSEREIASAPRAAYVGNNKIIS